MKRSEIPPLIAFGKYLVSVDLVTEYFYCDFESCRGRCCIEGESGAPLSEQETETLELCYSAYSGRMTMGGIAAVGRDGFFAVDRDGDLVTPLVDGTEECAFCAFESSFMAEDGVDPTVGCCYCTIERAYLEGRCDFRKPISCYLYPVRVKYLKSGDIALNLHRWDVCSGAYRLGREKGVRVYEFLKQPLIEAFGQDLWEALDAAARQINKNHI